jgi:multicomponent Na+:H+ antiporter subunit B
MTLKARRFLFFAAATALAGFFLWGMAGLPDFGDYNGRYGRLLNQRAVHERKATNVVAATTFDYRGFDTLGEEFILVAAVVGTAMLLRVQREESEEAPEDEAPDRRGPHDSDAVREFGGLMIPPSVLFGLYIVAHGHLTPGGGFQGGVILASAPVLMYLVGKYNAFRKLAPEPAIEFVEGTGAAAYAALGFVGVFAGAQFMANVLPLGRPEELFSAGLIPPINIAVGVAVSAGFLLLLSEFLEQTLMVRGKRK